MHREKWIRYKTLNTCNMESLNNKCLYVIYALTGVLTEWNLINNDTLFTMTCSKQIISFSLVYSLIFLSYAYTITPLLLLFTLMLILFVL